MEVTDKDEKKPIVEQLIKLGILIVGLPIPIGVLIFIRDMIGLGFAQGKRIGYGLHYSYLNPSSDELPIYTYLYFSNTLDVIFGALAILAAILTPYMILFIFLGHLANKIKFVEYFNLKAKKSLRNRSYTVEKKRDKENKENTVKAIKSILLIGLGLLGVFSTIYATLVMPKYAYKAGKESSKYELEKYLPCDDKEITKKRTLVCTCIYSMNKLESSGYAIYNRDKKLPLYVGNGVIMQPIDKRIVKRVTDGNACPTTWIEAKKESLSKDKGDGGTAFYFVGR